MDASFKIIEEYDDYILIAGERKITLAIKKEPYYFFEGTEDYDLLKSLGIPLIKVYDTDLHIPDQKYLNDFFVGDSD